MRAATPALLAAVILACSPPARPDRAASALDAEAPDLERAAQVGAPVRSESSQGVAAASRSAVDAGLAADPAPEDLPDADPRAGALADAEALPPAPEAPAQAEPLDVIGFAPASHAGPDFAAAPVWPRPVTVVIHGTLYRPEWECHRWKPVMGWYGWVLCPRGVRDLRAPLAQDRWTFKGRDKVMLEIEAGLKALEARYPGRVSRQGMVYVGASLGANMATDIVRRSPGQYDHLVLVEGGAMELGELAIWEAAGVKGVALAMSVPGRRKRAQALMGPLEAAGFRAAFIDMEGAGHNYRGDFLDTGRAGMRSLILGESR